MSWTHPICERCWFTTPGWALLDESDPSLDDRVRLPVVVRFDTPDEALATCARCGSLTVSGIYVRADPQTMPYAEEAADAVPDH